MLSLRSGGMHMKHQMIEDTLYFYFYGEFDNLSVMNLKQICIDLIEQNNPKKVVLDFEEVTFIDSTGIGFVLARYKQLKHKKAQLVVANLSQSNQTLFHMSGIFQIIKHERNEVKL